MNAGAGLPQGRSGSLRIFVIAGEHSGDQLGAGLMRSLKELAPQVSFEGVGGPAMERAGLSSLFPLADIAVMGLWPVIKKLPSLLARIRQTADAVIASRPDVLVIIDSPDFTHRVAAKVRQIAPAIPIIDYVSPTVWAWRPGRAPKMRAYVDHLLAVLPFEPDAHRRLGGPECTYVGHPLIERLSELRPNAEEAARRAAAPPRLLVLPGSRRSEIERLLDLFGETLEKVVERIGPVAPVLPAVSHLADDISARTRGWKIPPDIVLGEAGKYEAFRTARAALAASGTVTLELALAQVPMVVAYRWSPIEDLLRPFVKVSSVVLPNLVIGRNAVPEFLQQTCTAHNLAGALVSVLEDGPARSAQLDAFADVDARMTLPEGKTPSGQAARIVLDAMNSRRAAGR